MFYLVYYKISVVSQFYDTDVNKAYVIRGNAAILKCEIPSFVADFVSVVSWHTDQDETFYPSNDYGLFLTTAQLLSSSLDVNGFLFETFLIVYSTTIEMNSIIFQI